MESSLAQLYRQSKFTKDANTDIKTRYDLLASADEEIKGKVTVIDDKLVEHSKAIDELKKQNVDQEVKYNDISTCIIDISKRLTSNGL